jgi:hypothetical protein
MAEHGYGYDYGYNYGGAPNVTGVGDATIVITPTAVGEVGEAEAGVTGTGAAVIKLVASAGGFRPISIGPPMNVPAGSVPYYPPIFDEEPKKKPKPKPVTGKAAAIITLVAEAKGAHTAPVSGKASVVLNLATNTVAEHGRSHYEDDNAFFIMAA